MAKRELRGGHRDHKVGRGTSLPSDPTYKLYGDFVHVFLCWKKIFKLIIDFPLGDTNSQRQVHGSAFGPQSEGWSFLDLAVSIIRPGWMELVVSSQVQAWDLVVQ
jgi:hypothetical protein